MVSIPIDSPAIILILK
ncbi:hypothetical protein D030_4804A, partial [Vibrio parahaemolyticus AQ3810]